MAPQVDVTPTKRTITVTLTASEALEMKEWLSRARDAGVLAARLPVTPYGIELLYGAISAIAGNREYGGH